MQFETFEKIPYSRPDLAAALEQFRQYIAKFPTAKSFEEAKAMYLQIQEEMNHVGTMQTVAHIRYTCNTADPFYEGEMTYFNNELPKFGPLEKEANGLLLESPFRKSFEAEFGSYFIRAMEINQKLESDEIVDDQVVIANLCQDYSKLAAQCSTEFDGETCNFYGLLKHMQSTDRDERRRASQAWADLYEKTAPQLDGIFDKMVASRVAMAKKLGFDSFIDYAQLERGRYDYSREDLAKFRSYVKEYITPACAKLFALQEKRLGIDKLHSYDEGLLFPEGNAAPVGSQEELVNKAQQMYREMSKETGEFFDFMKEHRMFDLTSRPGKHMGGYCTFLQDYRSPFIFSNFNGTSADVDVLTHEAGHAFEAYTASQHLNLLDLVWSTSEINEIHSMTMEHFAYPWMELFFEDADKYRYYHLTDAFRSIPYLVSVDEFQHRVYAKPEMTAEERYAVWHEIEQTYMPWRDYDGNAFLEKGGFWMQKQHIFLYPFYYVDYAMAQICAFQYYALMKKDRAAAWDHYYHLCCVGGSKGYFELLQEGKLESPFNPETIKGVAEDIMQELLAQPY